MQACKPYQRYLIDSLKNYDEAAEYLRRAIEDGEEATIAQALQNIAKAQGGNWDEAIAIILLKLPLR